MTIDHLSATVLTIDSIKAVFEDMNIDADNLHGRLIAYLKNTTFHMHLKVLMVMKRTAHHFL
ncbi:UNVERIFIED_ORG: hypothetical protein [Escherichia phage CMSTMSU]